MANKNFRVSYGLDVDGGINATAGLVASGLTYPTSDGSNGQFLKTDGAGNLSWATVGGGGGSVLTIIGDDSSGTVIYNDRTFKFAGAGTITTSVSGDTLTITGSASGAQGITFVGDDSTGTRISDNETIKIAGARGITTAVSGDTLTITGPNLTNYAQKSDTAIIMVGDDSSGTAITIGETFKIAGGTNITTAVVNDTVTITGSKDINVNSISSTDSSAVQINDGLNVSGTLTASGLVANGITYPSTDGSANQVLVTNGSGILSFTSLSAFTGITFVGDDSSGSTINTTETLKFAGATGITTAVSGDTLTITGPNLSSYLTNSPITVVGDDSSGTTLNTGETIKIAGASNITTAVSGDTLTITGPNLSSYLTNSTITIVGDDSTGVTLNSNETIKITGTSNITTAVSGDTLTITGPNLSSYLTAVPKTIDVNEISSSDSSAIQINDAVNVSGTLTANTFVTNDISSGDSTAVQINDGVNVSGTLTANTLVTNNISSSESSAIQINDAVNVSGSLTANTLKTDSTATISGTLTANTIVTNDISSADSTAVQINDGLNVGGTLTANTFVTNNISSSESSAIQVDDAMNVSGTLTANTFVTNNISSSESSAIQVDDAMNVSGAFTANTLSVTTTTTNNAVNITYNPASAAGVAIFATGKDTNGGIGYFEFLKATNTTSGVTNGSKSFRVNSTGALEIINSAYDATIFSLTNAGLITSNGLTANGTVTFNAGYVEKINTLTAGTTITINCALAPVHKVTLTASTGFVITSLPTGGSVSVIVVQGGSGSYTATWGTDTSTAVKFAGGTPTLSTAVGAIDIVTIFNDGTNYYGDIGKAYA